MICPSSQPIYICLGLLQLYSIAYLRGKRIQLNLEAFDIGINALDVGLYFYDDVVQVTLDHQQISNIFPKLNDIRILGRVLSEGEIADYKIARYFTRLQQENTRLQQETTRLQDYTN